MTIFQTAHPRGQELGRFSCLKFAPEKALLASLDGSLCSWEPPRSCSATFLPHSLHLFSWPLHSRSICLTWLTSSDRTPSSCLENATPQGVSSPLQSPLGYLFWEPWGCATSPEKPASYLGLWLQSSKRSRFSEIHCIVRRKITIGHRDLSEGFAS